VGQVVSQSAQFAPFTHDYVYGNESEDQWKVFDAGRTRARGMLWEFLGFRLVFFFGGEGGGEGNGLC
jgi:hypothetical protein